MRVETLTPVDSPKPIGPYSHVAKAGPFVQISGTAGVDPSTGELAGPDAYSQARQILRNFRKLLAAAGSDMDHVLHVHVFLKDVDDFAELNRAYSEEFRGQLPARTVVAINDLPKKGAVLTMNLSAVTAE